MHKRRGKDNIETNYRRNKDKEYKMRIWRS